MNFKEWWGDQGIGRWGVPGTTIQRMAEIAWQASREATAREALGDVKLDSPLHECLCALARLLAMLPPAPAEKEKPVFRIGDDARVLRRQSHYCGKVGLVTSGDHACADRYYIWFGKDPAISFAASELEPVIHEPKPAEPAGDESLMYGNKFAHCVGHAFPADGHEAKPAPKYKVGDWVRTPNNPDIEDYSNQVGQVVMTTARFGPPYTYGVKFPNGHIVHFYESDLAATPAKPAVDPPERVPVGFEWTGEYGLPKEGEWVLGCGDCVPKDKAVQAVMDWSEAVNKHYILRKLPGAVKGAGNA